MKLSRFAMPSSQAPALADSIHSSPRHAELTAIPSNDFRDEIQHLERRHIPPHPKRYHESKRLRVERTYPPVNDVYFAHISPSDTVHQHTNETANIPSPKKSVDLSPCHICRRKPTVRSELDAFADCEGCGKRTCYICIRECLGSAVAVSKDTEMIDGLSFALQREDSLKADSGKQVLEGKIWGDGTERGHKGMVCSRCCVERGTEGEVWCLGCLRAEEGG